MHWSWAPRVALLVRSATLHLAYTDRQWCSTRPRKKGLVASECWRGSSVQFLGCTSAACDVGRVPSDPYKSRVVEIQAGRQREEQVARIESRIHIPQGDGAARLKVGRRVAECCCGRLTRCLHEVVADKLPRQRRCQTGAGARGTSRKTLNTRLTKFCVCWRLGEPSG